MPRRTRAVAATLLAVLLALGAGCAREDPGTRAVRRVSERYLRALVRKDIGEAKRLSTVVVPMTSIAGARVQSVGPAERSRLGALDSLMTAGERERGRADSLWARAGEATADSLFQLVRRLNRRQVMVRCAQRAAQISLPESTLTSAEAIELRRVIARVRYAGERVGPKPVDRELVLRLIRAGTGDWIVFSFFLPDDDAWPWRDRQAR